MLTMRRIVLIILVCLAVAAPVAPRLTADDCDGVRHIDDPPCTLCVTLRITDESGYCYASGHYEDSCTHEITGYWLYVC